MIHVTFFDRFAPWQILIALLAAMICAWRVGWLRGKRSRAEGREPPAEKLGDAIFGLFALLLAFTVGMALQKHDHRRQMVVAHSNSIGDFYTSAQMLHEPARGQLQGLIRDYTRLIIKATGEMHTEAFEQDLLVATRYTNAMADLVRDSGDAGSPFAIPLTNTLNEITSAQAARISAFEDRLPTTIILLMLMTAVIALGLAGWRHGAVATPQGPAPAFVIVLFALVIYVILDLDHPHKGLIRVSQAPIERLLSSMEK